MEQAAGDGRVGDRASVQVGLGDRVTGGAGQRRPGSERRDRRTGLVGGQIVRHRERAVERNPAGVGHEIAIADHLAKRVVDRGRSRFRDGQALWHRRGDRCGSRRRNHGYSGERAAGHSRVGDRARVQVGLRDRVAGGAGQRLARAERRDRRAGFVRGSIVVHREWAGERDSAGVGHQVVVADFIAQRIVRCRRSRLRHRKRWRRGADICDPNIVHVPAFGIHQGHCPGIKDKLQLDPPACEGGQINEPDVPLGRLPARLRQRARLATADGRGAGTVVNAHFHEIHIDFVARIQEIMEAKFRRAAHRNLDRLG